MWQGCQVDLKGQISHRLPFALVLELVEVTSKKSTFVDSTMIATLIFLLLFLTLFSSRFPSRPVTISFYFVSLVAILLLFFHHVTDPLDISL